MGEIGNITAREWIDLIDSISENEPDTGKIFFFWSPPYATVGLSTKDTRHPIDHILIGDWREMDDDGKYGYMNAVDRAGLRMFGHMIYL